MADYKRCVMILADGARPDIFEKLLKEGRLPNIDRYLIQRGSFHHAVTTFPSTTGPAYMPFLTGCYPGTCNVPGIRWFDKKVYATRPWSHKKFRSYVGFESYLMNRDMHRHIETLFNLIPKSINIFSGVSRGVSFANNKTRFFFIWNWYYAHLTDHWSMVDQSAQRKMLHSIENDPEFVFVVFPGIDEFSHIGHTESPTTFAAYEQVDQAIGELGRTLEKRGRLNDTVIMIVSDHGLSTTKIHLGVNQFLEKEGLRTFYYPKIFKKGFVAASMVSGNGMTHLYFPRVEKGAIPRRGDWRDFNYEETLSDGHREVLKKLLTEPAIDLMATRGEDGSVWVRRDGAVARIYREGKKIRYECLEGDPLSYGPIPSCLSAEEWLEATCQSDYPDAPVQLLQIFHSARSGDVILSAAPGYDLREHHEVPEHKGTHGSLHRSHMMIPVLSSVPLKGGTLRSVDIFPTVCELLGRAWNHEIDGISRT